MFTAPYSPELKPIEHGFGLVRREIQSKYAELIAGRLFKVQLIDQSFRKYSAVGSHSFVGMTNFSIINLGLLLLLLIVILIKIAVKLFYY